MFIIFCLAAVAAFGFLFSCSSDGAAYYVRFTANGQSYELTKGYTDISNGDAVGFTEGARGGPITPILAIPPIPPIPAIPPIPPISTIPPITPIFSLSWSSGTLEEFFTV